MNFSELLILQRVCGWKPSVFPRFCVECFANSYVDTPTLLQLVDTILLGSGHASHDSGLVSTSAWQYVQRAGSEGTRVTDDIDAAPHVREKNMSTGKSRTPWFPQRLETSTRRSNISCGALKSVQILMVLVFKHAWMNELDRCRRPMVVGGSCFNELACRRQAHKRPHVPALHVIPHLVGRCEEHMTQCHEPHLHHLTFN